MNTPAQNKALFAKIQRAVVEAFGKAAVTADTAIANGVVFTIETCAPPYRILSHANAIAADTGLAVTVVPTGEYTNTLTVSTVVT